MPHFFFDTYDGDDCQRDQEGLDLPDLEAVRAEVFRMLPDIARDEIPKNGDRRDFITDVRDGAGRMVFTATLSLVARQIS